MPNTENVPMEHDEALVVEIHVDSQEPFFGFLVAPTDDPWRVPFQGWLSLLAALSDVLQPARSDAEGAHGGASAGA